MKTHGHASHGKISPTYASWVAMISRCTNPGCNSYELYGGSGIVVCERWLHSFQNFLSDMGKRLPGTQIGRDNSLKNYEPGNCKWVTLVENARNRRSNRIVLFGSERITAIEASIRLKVKYSTFLMRIRSLGWPRLLDVSQVKFNQPKNGERNPNAKLTDRQVELIRQSANAIPALAVRFGVSWSTVYRIRRSMAAC